MIDPRDGSILAAYSNPTFDPNLVSDNDTEAEQVATIVGASDVPADGAPTVGDLTNPVLGLTDVITDSMPLYEEAIANAKEKAKELAKDLGVSLGDLRSFNEGGSYMPAPMYDRAMEAVGMGGGGGAPPLPAGEQEVRVSVSLTYEVR